MRSVCPYARDQDPVIQLRAIFDVIQALADMIRPSTHWYIRIRFRHHMQKAERFTREGKLNYRNGQRAILALESARYDYAIEYRIKHDNVRFFYVDTL